MSEKEFRQKVMPLQRIMFGIAMKMDIPPDDAADAVQETLVRLWQRRGLLPHDERGIRLYCLAAFRNECISMLRRKRISEPLDQLNDTADSTPDASLTTQARDARDNIESLIDTLPAAQRTVLRLSSFGELDNAEIAEATGQSPQNVRQLLSRGRRRLLSLLNNP